jgi:hypothetical protein
MCRRHQRKVLRIQTHLFAVVKASGEPIFAGVPVPDDTNHPISALMILTKWVLAVVSEGEVYLLKTILDGALWVDNFGPSLSFSMT